MADLFIYDVIGSGLFDEGVTAASVRDELAQLDDREPIDVRINSEGGDVFQAVAIKTLLDRHEGPVSYHVDGLAASAASFLPCGGQTITIAEGAMMMIHDPWSITIGDKADHEKTVGLLDKVAENIAEMYAQQTGKPEAEVRKAMLAETWFTAAEAVEFGLATEVASRSAKAFTLSKAFAYKRPPKLEQRQPSYRIAAMRRQIALKRATSAL